MLDLELVASLQHLADSQVSLAVLMPACRVGVPRISVSKPSGKEYDSSPLVCLDALPDLATYSACTVNSMTVSLDRLARVGFISAWRCRGRRSGSPCARQELLENVPLHFLVQAPIKNLSIFIVLGSSVGGSTQQSILSQDIDRCVLDLELVASLQHLADSQVSLAALSTACPTLLPSRRASHLRLKA